MTIVEAGAVEPLVAMLSGDSAGARGGGGRAAEPRRNDSNKVTIVEAGVEGLVALERGGGGTLVHAAGALAKLADGNAANASAMRTPRRAPEDLTRVSGRKAALPPAEAALLRCPGRTKCCSVAWGATSPAQHQRRRQRPR